MDDKIMEGYNLVRGWITGIYDERLAIIQVDGRSYSVMKDTVHNLNSERPPIPLD